MVEIDETTAAAYAIEHRLFPAGADLQAEFLSGGVSNAVLRITDAATQHSLVLKQARERLRTAVEWRSRLDRIWREVAALRVLGSLVPEGIVPRVLFEDRDNFLFAMTAVPAGHSVWKRDLLSGVSRPDVYPQVGSFLGRVHSGTWHGAHVLPGLRDQKVFDELRLDPYYRWIGRRHPELRDELQELVASTSASRHCLTLADLSPKNILLFDGRMTVLDFETAHLGEPAFDVGFFLTHLVLKAIHLPPAREEILCGVRGFLAAYRREFEDATVPLEVEARSLRHVAACLLARVDGKSPVDYLTAEEQSFVRTFAKPLVKTPATSWLTLESRIRSAAACGL